MARSIPSIVLFGATVLVAGAVITSGAVFTVERLADAVAATPVKTKLRPSYVAALPPVRATALDIARFVPVEPVTTAAGAASRPPRLTHEVAVKSLWVRAGPNKQSARLVALAQGARLAIARRDGSWLLVSGPNGGRGWVYSAYVRPVSP